MPTTIPRDPIAVKAARLAIGLMVLLLIISALPRPASTAAPVQAQAPAVPPIFVASTATPRLAPEPPPADAPPVLAAATAEPAQIQPIAAVPAGDAPPAGSQLVTNADGSVSLPGSEAWMQPQTSAAPATDPTLQDAADAYKALPVAAPPSLENQQPNYSKRPHTGR